MDFLDVLNEKIEELKSEEETAQSNLLSPQVHVTKLATVISNVIPDIQDLPDDVEVLRREFVSVLQQVPQLCQDNWSEMILDVQKKQQELGRWEEMASLYSGWQESQTVEKSLEEAIASGEIPEPSKMTAIRRKPGTKPPVSLRKHREITSKLKSGEDSEG